MRNFNIDRTLVTLVIGSILLVAGCSSNTVDTTTPVSQPPVSQAPNDLPVLRVGMALSYPPIAYEEAGKPAGLEVELANELADDLGMKLQIVKLYFPRLIPALERQQIDIIMNGLTITVQRSSKVAFADSYLTIGQQAMVRKSDLAPFKDISKVIVTDKMVGVAQGTTSSLFVQHRMPYAKKIDFPMIKQAADALAHDQIDLIIHDSPSILWLSKQFASWELKPVPGLLTQEKLAWAVNRDNSQLLDKANKVLSKWKSSGKLQKIIDKWLPGAKASP